MTAVAIQRMNRSSAGIDWFPYRRIMRAIVVSMSKGSGANKKPWERQDLSPQERFEAFLEGYLMSFDVFPVCGRHLFAKRDIHAILQDFWAIGADVNHGVQDLIDAPTLELKSVSSDDEQRRRVEAARRALEAVQRARFNRSEN